jgi:membrane protein DedA with SNARE-associated domain
MPNQQRRPDPEPLKTNDKLIVWVGIALWAVALLVLGVFFRDDLRRHHAEWWLWTCVVGIGIGFWGMWVIRNRDGG